MSFVTSTAYKSAMEAPPAIALVTGGKSGIGKALALKIASFPFIDVVLAVSRSIQDSDVSESPKITALAADVSTVEGRELIVQEVDRLCGGSAVETRIKQLRFLIHSAGVIEPIKPVLQVRPEELRHAMNINCEAPLFLTTALYPYMERDRTDSEQGAGRVLHVSSGAAHGAPPVGWSCYSITKAAFFQSYKVLECEFRHAGGNVVVGSFKPGIVDTTMQGVIRDAPATAMPSVGNFKAMKDRFEVSDVGDTIQARPPPAGALDSPENVACFAESLLIGTTDEEFANANDPNEYDIRNAELYPRWIPAENLPLV
jgi:NAD(P)-dependent dehydrogenase (short-subunit alcohol dehydrogenase family)